MSSWRSAPGEGVVRGHLLLGSGGGGRGGAGLGHGVERFLLMSGVALDGFHEVGDEVVPTLQLRIDVLPGVVDAVAQGDEVVVDAGDAHDDGHDDDDADDERESHVCPFPCWRSGAELVVRGPVYPSRQGASSSALPAVGNIRSSNLISGGQIVEGPLRYSHCVLG